jgi:hypothetical protein
MRVAEGLFMGGLLNLVCSVGFGYSTYSPGSQELLGERGGDERMQFPESGMRRSAAKSGGPDFVVGGRNVVE